MLGQSLSTGWRCLSIQHRKVWRLLKKLNYTLNQNFCKEDLKKSIKFLREHPGKIPQLLPRFVLNHIHTPSRRGVSVAAPPWRLRTSHIVLPAGPSLKTIVTNISVQRKAGQMRGRYV